MTIEVRTASIEDVPGVSELCRAVYPKSPAWTVEQLESHQRVFPRGQFVAIDVDSRALIGMAASLIVKWDDYDVADTWRRFTARGMFTNHDPEHGRTLYGAEVMVHPDHQGRGIGSKLYDARRALVEELKLLRIRAGARLRGYHQHADRMTAEEYVEHVVRGELRDPTLSFQLGRGFRVLAVVHDYLRHDPESLGNAALIEWLNPAAPEAQPPR